MIPAIWCEVLKLRRSRAWWLTLLAFTVVDAMGGLFMFIGQDRERARALGLLGTKAQLTDIAADWDGYFALLAQIVAVGGTLVFGMLTIWMFGREFSDHTVKDLLALPTSRTAIVTAKFTVTAGWCLILAGYLFLLALTIGAFLRLPGWSGPLAIDNLVTLLTTSILTGLLMPSFALAASIGRGYLPAVGTLFVTVFLAQITTVLGYGAYFPFSIPALHAQIGGPDQTPPGPVSFLLVLTAWTAAVSTTLIWWRHADQHT
jgi:ABC-2 type transport system permease protein